MKVLKAIAVFILIVGFPLGSWLFLQQGLDWRRVKRAELEVKMDLKQGVPLSMDEKKAMMSVLDGSTTFVVLGESYSESDKAIIDQFKDAFSFQSKLQAEVSNSFGATFSNDDYLLIDTAMMLRQRYSGNHDSIYSRIVEDIALLLPKQKEIDIKMKSSNNE